MFLWTVIDSLVIIVYLYDVVVLVKVNTKFHFEKGNREEGEIKFASNLLTTYKYQIIMKFNKLITNIIIY